MPSRKVSMRSSLTNKTSIFGIMGGLYNRKISGRSSMNRVTSRLVIPASAKEGYQYMKMHNILSRNPLGSGGIGKMFRLAMCSCYSMKNNKQVNTTLNMEAYEDTGKVLSYSDISHVGVVAGGSGSKNNLGSGTLPYGSIITINTVSPVTALSLLDLSAAPSRYLISGDAAGKTMVYDIGSSLPSAQLQLVTGNNNAVTAVASRYGGIISAQVPLPGEIVANISVWTDPFGNTIPTTLNKPTPGMWPCCGDMRGEVVSMVARPPGAVWTSRDFKSVFAAADESGKIFIWGPTSKTAYPDTWNAGTSDNDAKSELGRADACTKLIALKNGALVGCGDGESAISIWTKESALSNTFITGEVEITALTTLPYYELEDAFASGDASGNITIWTPEGKLYKTGTAPKLMRGSVQSLTGLSNNRIAAAYTDGYILLVEIPDGGTIVSQLSFAPRQSLSTALITISDKQIAWGDADGINIFNVPCQAGMQRVHTASPSCTQCPEGTSSDTGAVAGCLACKPGTYAANSGSYSCTTCPAGTYADNSGSSSCTPCQAGTSSQAGSTSNRACSAPAPSPGTGDTLPPPPTGYWCGTTWADATKCQSKCDGYDTSCPAGEHCYSGQVCAPGYW